MYDAKESIVYWLYDDGSIVRNSITHYTKAIVLNVFSNAFYPWVFSDNSTTIRGAIYTQDSVGISVPTVKYVFSYQDILTSAVTHFNYADTTRSNQYVDWRTYAQEVSGIPGDAVSYPSFFVTGYKVHGELLKFVQPNYVMVFLEAPDPQEGILSPGCFIQGVFDFATDERSGKWGTKQQIYNENLQDRSINYRRLKIRGKGRSIQFKFTNDGAKPFTIIGWGGLETTNREV